MNVTGSKISSCLIDPYRRIANLQRFNRWAFAFHERNWQIEPPVLVEIQLCSWSIDDYFMKLRSIRHELPKRCSQGDRIDLQPWYRFGRICNLHVGNQQSVWANSNRPNVNSSPCYRCLKLVTNTTIGDARRKLPSDDKQRDSKQDRDKQKASQSATSRRTLLTQIAVSFSHQVARPYFRFSNAPPILDRRSNYGRQELY